LHEKVILGADFINKQLLGYDPCKREVHWTGARGDSSDLKVTAAITIPEFSSRAVQLKTELGQRQHVVAEIFREDCPHLGGGPGLVQTDEEGKCLVELFNSGPEPIFLQRSSTIGQSEALIQGSFRKIDAEVVDAIVSREAARGRRRSPASKDREEKILEAAKLPLSADVRKKYEELLLKHHDVFSLDKGDLGFCDAIEHHLTMKTPEPVFVKQFKIPEAHQQYLQAQVREWLKLGIIQPSNSRYNSPLFLVEKKDGTYRVVQDFRSLNAHTYVDKYSMKDVTECIAEIGRAGSKIFTTLDLTSGFWQMALDASSRPYTAFTVPGMGQFEWKVVSMGLASAPGAFQRLIELVMKGLDQVVVYIDDVIIHSATHEEHLQRLDEVLTRLAKHNLKANLKKCSFGATETMYLGFRLTEDGIVPGTDKLKAVKEAQPPSSVKQVRQFLGLCNFFRGHIQHFAQLTAPLTNLTKKDSGWKHGALPEDALRAFRQLQSLLCSEPVLSYPRRGRTYALITDASFGDEKIPGGLGAILTQVDEKGLFHVISYASRKLQKYEKNYTPFLLEMQAAIFGMETFDVYLRGRKFLLFTDHKPLEKLGKVHSKTLNRLQQMMTSFDFEIIYKKGSEMPADFLSRNAVDAIGLDLKSYSLEQDKDEFLRALRLYLLNRNLPENENLARLVLRTADDCFVQNGVVWKRLDKQHNFRPVMLVPPHLKDQIISEAHGQELSGHFGILKTKEKILDSYFWPNMESDISDHLRRCRRCQMTKPNRNPPQLLTPLPQCTEPNQRVHADLFGPLKTTNGDKKYLLCMTDAFTKYVELVAVPNKEAGTVASALINRWVCRFGVPLEFVTDQGREFKNVLWTEITKQLNARHSTTSAHHPQCNSQAEVCNKTIASYLASMVDETTLNWEEFIPALMFCYNTSFHRSIKTSPFFLTFGIEPRTPAFFATDIRRFLQEDHQTALQRLAEARKVAIENNLLATENYKSNFDKNATFRIFHPGQWVLLDEFNFLGKNRKLSPKFSGPFKLLRLKGDSNAEIVVNNGRKMIVNVSRLRPFFGSSGDDNDFSSLRGGRGADEEVTDANEETISGRDTHTRSLSPTRAHTLSDERPEPVGPSAHTRARVRAEQQQQQDKPSLIQVRLDSDKKKPLPQMITAVSSQQRKRKKLVKRFDEARDPYQYSEGCEAGPVTEAQAGVDGQLDGQQQQHPDQLYRDLLQHLRDFADDATDEEDEEDHFSDADDDDFGIKIDRDPDADADGNWIEGADGWKEWTPNRDGGPGAAGLPEQAAGADQGAGQLEGSDWEIDLSLATPSQQEDFCVKVFEETVDIEQETARALWEQQDREVREQLRERNLRARRHLKDIVRYVSPDIQANARRRTPLTKLPGAAEGQAPIPKPRTVISKLKPRKIRFEDEVEEDDDGPPSRRTRRHGTVDEAPRQGPRL
jgi:transposase InsO family protein